MTATDWRALLAAGREAVGSGRAEPALRALRRAREAAPMERDVRYWLGNALRLAGLGAEAEAEFRALLERDPGDEETAFALAWLLREQGRTREAGETLLRLARAEGTDAPVADPVAHLNRLLKITGFLRDSNRFEDAIETLREALRIRPGDAGLSFRLARLYQATGRFEEALAELRAAVDRDPALGGAWLSLAQLQKFTDEGQPDLQRLRSAAERPAGAEAEMCLSFALGKAYDDLGAWSLAWKHYARGNRLRHAMQPWDREGWRRQVETLLTMPVRLSEPPARPTRHPVYVVGMLRSGTTLLESLLDRHPRVTGRGELNFLAHQAESFMAQRSAQGDTRRAGQRIGHRAAADDASFDARAAGEELWTHLRLDGPEDGWYVDKNPLNFRFLGGLAEMLPEARIVHVARDGRDACLSCWFQLFQHPDAGFANALDDLLDYYDGYRRLMRRWREELGERILTVAYEELVGDTQATLRRVLDHLGLGEELGSEALGSEYLFPESHSDAASHGKRYSDPNSPSSRPIRTASAWQARQPVYAQSIGRWRNYREFAPKFFEALAEADGA